MLPNSPKSILLLTSEFPPLPGGIGNHACMLAKYLQKNGFEVSVVTDFRDKNQDIVFDAKQIFTVYQKYLKERGGIEVENFYEYLSSFGYHCFYIERLGLEKVDIKNFKHKSSKNWLCIQKQEMHKLRQINNSIFLNCFNPFL